MNTLSLIQSNILFMHNNDCMLHWVATALYKLLLSIKFKTAAIKRNPKVRNWKEEHGKAYKCFTFFFIVSFYLINGGDGWGMLLMGADGPEPEAHSRYFLRIWQVFLCNFSQAWISITPSSGNCLFTAANQHFSHPGRCLLSPHSPLGSLRDAATLMFPPANGP